MKSGFRCRFGRTNLNTTLEINKNGCSIESKEKGIESQTAWNLHCSELSRFWRFYEQKLDILRICQLILVLVVVVVVVDWNVIHDISGDYANMLNSGISFPIRLLDGNFNASIQEFLPILSIHYNLFNKANKNAELCQFKPNFDG